MQGLLSSLNQNIALQYWSKREALELVQNMKYVFS